MDGKLRWGIIGTGAIAKLFAQGLKDSRTGVLHAVGSRSQATADAVGREHGAKRCYGNYDGVVGDNEVDAIYVATPHSMHRENSILALKAGKPVLCEKPFAINAAEAREVIALARKKKLFLMEAMWTRFFPVMGKVRELVAEGAIGDIRMIEADFGFRTEIEADGRLFDPQFGGGSLLDVGIYPLSFASMLLGKAERIATMADIGTTGVDEQAAFVLGYAEGRLAICTSAVRTDTPQEASVIGTTGYLRIDSPFWRPSSMTLFRGGKAESRFELPYRGNGYTYEADEVAECLAAEKLESEVMPLRETIELMETMDAVRREWGLRYPME